MSKYKILEERFCEIEHLVQVKEILFWDRVVMMPDGAINTRSEAMASLDSFINRQLRAPEIGEMIMEIEGGDETLNSWQMANVREMKRAWLDANSVTSDLVEAKTIAGARCEQAWRTLRAENNWKDFLPHFEPVIRLSREEAMQRAQASAHTPYEALVQKYEPGLTIKKIESVFSELKKFLPGFIQDVVEKQKSEKFQEIKEPIAVEKQRELGLELMKRLGFDFSRGRLDVSHHPFCGGTVDDVRLTTRYDENQFTESLQGIIHETGHALYNQNIPSQWSSQPVGAPRGMAVHESQSLLYEMQVGRSLPFMKFASPLFKRYLSVDHHSPKAWTLENLAGLFTRVRPSYIRVSADEVTYPLHVILRFEMELDLIGGRIEPREIPDLWNEKMKSYLGLSTEGNFKDGCMQDVHWTDGTFGYFPCYTIGALMAAQIYRTSCRQHPEIPRGIEDGQFGPLFDWLKERVWSQASYSETEDLLVYATGEHLNPQYFLDHLKERYLGN